MKHQRHGGTSRRDGAQRGGTRKNKGHKPAKSSMRPLPKRRKSPVVWGSRVVAHLEQGRKVLRALRRLMFAAAGVAAAVVLLIAVLSQF